MTTHLRILRGEPGPEDWRRIGELLAEGYIMGVNSPVGIYWDVFNTDDTELEVRK